jgi:hypothetical protein
MDTQYGAIVKEFYTCFVNGTYSSSVIPKLNGQSLLNAPSNIQSIREFMASNAISVVGSTIKPNTTNLTNVTDNMKLGSRELIVFCNKFLSNLRTQYSSIQTPLTTEQLVSVYLTLVAVVAFLKAALVTYILILSHNIGKQQEQGKQQADDFESLKNKFEMEKKLLTDQLKAKEGNANVQQKLLVQQINDLKVVNENDLKQKNVQLQEIKNQVAELSKDKSQVETRLSLF